VVRMRMRILVRVQSDVMSAPRERHFYDYGVVLYDEEGGDGLWGCIYICMAWHDIASTGCMGRRRYGVFFCIKVMRACMESRQEILYI